jgi:aminopeptidase N
MKSTHVTVVALLAALIACAPAPEPKPGAAGLGDPNIPWLGNGGYDVQHYTLDLAIDAANNQLAGTAVLQAQAAQALSAFNLDLLGLQVESVTVNGAPADHLHAGTELTVEPERPLREGSSFEVTVAYRGTPQPLPAEHLSFPSGWQKSANGIFVMWGVGNGATWFPNNNHASDKATYTFRLTVQPPLLAIANGTLAEQAEADGAVTYVWEMNDPIYSDGATLFVSEYAESAAEGPGGLPLLRYLPPGHAAAEAQAFEPVPEILEFLIKLYGPFPFDSIGVISERQLPIIAAAVPSRVLFTPEGAQQPTLLAHELAHQWFGESVTPASTEDMWLSEGFATYTELLWQEHNGDAIEGRLLGFYAERTVPPGNPPAEALLERSVYAQGALTLHALRVEVGDESFFEILRTYAERYRHSSASTVDFVALAEEVSGERLEPLFDRWLYAGQTPPIDELGLGR